MPDREEVTCPVEVFEYLRWQAEIDDPTAPVPGADDIDCFKQQYQGREFYGIEQCFPLDPEANPELADYEVCARTLYRPNLEPTGLSSWDPQERVKMLMVLRKSDCTEEDEEGIVSCIHTVVGTVPITPDMISQTGEERRTIQEEAQRLLAAGDLEGTPLEYTLAVDPEGTASLTPVGAFFGLKTWVAGQAEYDLGQILYNPEMKPPLELGWNNQMISQMRRAFRKTGADQAFREPLRKQLITLAQEHPDWFWERDAAGLIPLWAFSHTIVWGELCDAVPLDATGGLAQICLRKNIPSSKYSADEYLQIATTNNNPNVREMLVKGYVTPAVINILAHDPDPNVRKSVIFHHHITPELLEEFALDPDPEVRAELANHTHLPEEIIAILAEDESVTVRKQLAQHKKYGNALAQNFTPAIIKTLVHDPSPKVRALIAEDPDLPVKHMRELAHDSSPSVRASLAFNVALPPDILQVLAEDSSPEVLRTLAKQHFTKLETHNLDTPRILAVHPSQRKAIQLTKRENLDPEILDLLSRHPAPSVRNNLVEHHPLSLSPSQMQRIVESLSKWDIDRRMYSPKTIESFLPYLDPSQKIQFAQRKELTPATIASFAQDPDPQVRSKILRHHSSEIPPTLLETLKNDPSPEVQQVLRPPPSHDEIVENILIDISNVDVDEL